MADKKITELPNINGADLVDADEFVVVDISADETKAITLAELKNAFDAGTGFVRVTGDTMTGALDVQSTITADGLTVNTGVNTSTRTFLVDNAHSGGSMYNSFGVYVGATDRLVTLSADYGESIMAFSTNGSERMRIDSSGNVGIGCTPAHGIQTGNFRGTGSAPSFSGTSGDGFAFDYYNAGNPYPRHGSIAVIGSGTSTADLSFWTDSGSAVAERMRIDSSGNVGIGVNNPSDFDSGAYNLVVGSPSVSSQGITIVADTNSIMYFADGTSGTEAYMGSIIYNHLNNDMTFRTNGFNTAMVIDSSRNVLVGKTSTTFGTAGIGLLANGELTATKAGQPASFNRLSSDGNIIGLYKDSSLVGSIGSSNTGERLYMVNDSTGLSFLGDFSKILPCDSAGAPRDAAIDLGQGSGGRFKDLYLSGGVYLGGTDTAHKLDDYEEGTWTPTGYSGGTLYNARYTKVGRLVTASAYVNGTSFTSSLMGGLPFTSEQGWTAGTLGLNDSTNINNCEVSSSSNNINFRQGATSATPNGSGLMVSVTYHAA